jgi:hypothetical protein
LQILFNRQQDERDQEKDMDQIRTKIDEIARIMVKQQENIEDTLNRRFNSFKYHLEQNIRKVTNAHVSQTMEEQKQLFLPIPWYDLRVEDRIGQGKHTIRSIYINQKDL